MPISEPLQHCHPLLGFNGKALQTADLRGYDEEGKQGSKIKNLQKLMPYSWEHNKCITDTCQCTFKIKIKSEQNNLTSIYHLLGIFGTIWYFSTRLYFSFLPPLRLLVFYFKSNQHWGIGMGYLLPHDAALHCSLPSHLFRFHISNLSLTLHNVTGMKLLCLFVMQKAEEGNWTKKEILFSKKN